MKNMQNMPELYTIYTFYTATKNFLTNQQFKGESKRK